MKLQINKVLPKTVSLKANRLLLQGEKYSPQILFGVGVVSMGASIALACRATLKTGAVIEEHNKNEADIERCLKIVQAKDYAGKPYSENDAKRDRYITWSKTVAAFAKLYAPAVLTAAVAVASFGGAQRILSVRNASLVGAFKLSEETLNKYRERVAEELGDDKEYTLFHDLQKEEVSSEDENGKTVKKEVYKSKSGMPSMHARFFDEANINWSRHDAAINRLFLSSQQNYLNDVLVSRGHVFLNEAYDALGMERSSAGAVVGWVLGGDGDNYIDFGIFDSGNVQKRAFVNGDEPSILLDFNVDGVIYDKIEKKRS